MTFKEVIDRVVDLQGIRHAIEIPSDWGPPGPAIMLSCVPDLLNETASKVADVLPGRLIKIEPDRQHIRTEDGTDVWVIARESPTYSMFGSLDEVIRT